MRPPPSGTTLFLESACQCDISPGERILVRVRNVGGVAQASVILSIEGSRTPGEPFGLVDAGVAGRSLFALLGVNRIVPPGETPLPLGERGVDRFRLLRSDDEGDSWRSLGEMDSYANTLNALDSDGTPLLINYGGQGTGNLFRWRSGEIVGARTRPTGVGQDATSEGSDWWWDGPSHSLVSSTTRIYIPGVNRLGEATRNPSGGLAAQAYDPTRETIIVDASGTIVRRSREIGPTVWLDGTYVAGWGPTGAHKVGPLILDVRTGDIFEVDGLQTIPQPESFFAPIRTLEPLR